MKRAPGIFQIYFLIMLATIIFAVQYAKSKETVKPVDLDQIETAGSQAEGNCCAIRSVRW